MRKNGEGNIEVVAFPCECKACSEDEYKLFGCGFHGYDGKSEIEYNAEGGDDYWKHTCPKYAASFSFVNEILFDVENFKRGAMGNVFHMDNLRFELLSIAEQERIKWETVNQRQLMDNHK